MVWWGQAPLNGAPSASVKARMLELEARQELLEREVADKSTSPPILEPDMARIHRDRVADLTSAPNAPDARAEAADALRKLPEAVVLTPDPNVHTIELRGDLAGILALVAGISDATGLETEGAS